MSKWEQMRAWQGQHPLTADAVLAVAVFVVGLLVRPDGPGGLGTVSASSVIILAAACSTLLLRRRFPLPVWAATTALAFCGVLVTDGPSAAVLPVFVAVYTVATERSDKAAIGAAIGTVLVLIVALVITESSALSSPTTYAVVAWGGMAVAIGIAVRGQRAVVAAAEERARQAEESRDEQARQAVTEERLRIARELHDVVAHNIAVINVQAGVARHLLPSDPEQAAEALGNIRDSSQVVLSEMSTILGLLRAPDEPGGNSPAPRMADFDALIESMRRSGMTVTVRTSGSPAALPQLTDLTLYRLLQEALTNAGKHGTGTVEVALTYTDQGVTVDVWNPVGPSQEDTSTGHGLIGMSERVATVDGRLTTGVSSGTYHVHAELPLLSAATQAADS